MLISAPSLTGQKTSIGLGNFNVVDWSQEGLKGENSGLGLLHFLLSAILKQ